MGRVILNFNTDWEYIPEDIEKAKEINFHYEKAEKVSIPHSNKIVPRRYFSETEYEFISWYRRYFYIDENYKNKRLIVEFDGVMTVADVFVNGQHVGCHKGGYTSFAFDITQFVNFGKENLLTVRVDSRERQDIPPEGNVVDYLLFGGIYREVRLKIVHPVYLTNEFWAIIEAERQQGIIQAIFEIVNEFEEEKELQICTRILDRDGREVAFNKEKKLISPGSQNIKTGKLKIESPILWDLNNPYLYRAVGEVYCDQKLIDKIETRIGIRSIEFRKNGGFYLNGERIKLRGLNRHQMFPYIGNAMPARGQKKDAEILKYELGVNFVRSSHYPPSPAFLDRCDEIGLLVFEEIPGWQHIGDKKWKEIAIENLKEMILRDRNHPSIFLWGVRINESPDDHDFYIKTNYLARELDPTRFTGGVRDFQESEFLEDVFTYNDFEFNRKGEIKYPNKIPYMITEYGGHKYPTKADDSVERLINHALIHVKVQDKQYRNPFIAGASGWCAFDYNTHQDFGSGDRICYHGVCDMFRLPKFAAYFYRSQQDPEVKPVVFIARYLIPSFNEDYDDELIVFSNCEEVALYTGDKLHAISRPDYNNYPALPHPPFVFKNCRWWEWGASTVGNITAVGLINGQEVERHTIYPFGQPEKIKLTADFDSIIADGADMTRVVLELKDDKDQTLHLSRHPVFLELEGPGTLIGENPFVLEAGRGAVFVQSKREAGEIKLKAFVEGVDKTEITIISTPLEECIVPLKGGN